MLLYLLKFTIILTLLHAFYKVVLENENMHVFKRFYLIISVLVAFGIPLITLTSYVEITSTSNIINAIPILENNKILQYSTQTHFFPFILWSIYGIGALTLCIKFVYNLSSIISKIEKNQKFKKNGYTNILIDKLESPYTFFNYIFLNKLKFNSNKIPQEIFLHEQTHAKQKHSFDIIFIEILQIFLWFHPLLYFIKKSIKLNHEFLADKAVLNKGITISNYQNTLLTFSNKYSNKQLVNAINYPSIKKRFKVMKTKTSKQTAWLKSLVLLPLLAILIYGFSNRVVAQKPIQKDTIVIAEVFEIKIDKNKNIFLAEKQISLNNLKDALYNKISHSSKEQMEIVSCNIKAEGKINMSFLQKITKEINKAGIFKISFYAPVFEMDKEGYQENIEISKETIKLIVDKMVLNQKSKNLSIDDVLKLPKDEDASGWVYINNQTLFYEIINKTLTFYNRYANKVDKNGVEIK